MAAESLELSPKVPSKRNQRGSVAISTWGDNAVAIPNARYSCAAILPNCWINSGLKVAAMPSELGHMEIKPPAAALNSARACVPWRGSVLLLAGIPLPNDSQNAWILLFHFAASSGDETVVTSTWRRLSSFRNFFCWSVNSLASIVLGSKGFPLYVPAKYPSGLAGMAWWAE